MEYWNKYIVISAISIFLFMAVNILISNQTLSVIIIALFTLFLISLVNYYIFIKEEYNKRLYQKEKGEDK